MTVRNVRTYGAVGDGVTDDYAAFAAANAAATSGDTVYVPGSATAYVLGTSFQLKSGVALTGDGIDQSTIKGVYASVGQTIIKNDWTGAGDTDLAVRDLTIDRSGTNSGHGIRIQNADGCHLARVKVTSYNPSLTQGAIIIGGFAANTVDPTVTAVLVEDCEVDTPDNFGISLGAVDHAVVRRCVIRNAYRQALGVEPGQLLGAPLTTADVWFKNCTVTFGSTGSGTQTGTVIITRASGGVPDDVTVQDCTLTSLGVIPSNISPGFFVSGTNHIIQRNTITGANGSGIVLGSATGGDSAIGCIVRNNVIQNANSGGSAVEATGSGIILRNAATTSNEVYENRIYGTTTLVTLCGQAAGTTGSSFRSNGDPIAPAHVNSCRPSMPTRATMGALTSLSAVTLTTSTGTTTTAGSAFDLGSPVSNFTFTVVPTGSTKVSARVQGSLASSTGPWFNISNPSTWTSTSAGQLRRSTGSIPVQYVRLQVVAWTTKAGGQSVTGHIGVGRT